MDRINSRFIFNLLAFLLFALVFGCGSNPDNNSSVPDNTAMKSEQFVFKGAITVITLEHYQIIRITADEESFEIYTTEETEYNGIDIKKGSVTWNLGHIYEVKGDTVKTLTLKDSYAYENSIIAKYIRYLNPPPYDPDKALRSAIGWGSLSEVKEAIENGANISHRNKRGDLAIHDAVGRGKLEVIEFLINSGADINAQGYQGKTCLHYAASHREVEVLEFLLTNGADATIEDKYGSTPWSSTFNKECRDIFRKYDAVYK